jgi:hypothetical protein
MSLTTVAVVKVGSYIWAFVKETFLRDTDMEVLVRRNKWTIISLFFFVLSTIGMAIMYDLDIKLAEQLVDTKKQLTSVEKELADLKAKPDQSLVIEELKRQVANLQMEINQRPMVPVAQNVPRPTVVKHTSKSTVNNKLAQLRE